MAPEIPNYELKQPLGAGAMAEVWLAEHRRNGRKAAIKVLKPAAVADSDFEQLFLREGQVLASFDHPNIVRIYDNDRSGDLAYLVMEYLPGGTLLERMQRRPITIGEAVGLVAQIASGLEAAHRQQVIHRDLKPANILLRDETTPVLTDFGAARLLDRSTIYGREGMIVGTPIYMSPEQVSGQTLSGSSDLYALGVIFYELLTGERPFPGTSFPEIAAQHLYAPIPRLPAAIAMLQPVLDRLLAKQPGDRYPDAQAFIDALRTLYIHDEALRLQVGYAGTSTAWSSQLRALGFVLDIEQKQAVRVAQGRFLEAPLAQTAPLAPVTAAPSATTDAAMPRRRAPYLWVAIATLAALALAYWQFRPQPASVLAPPVSAVPAPNDEDTEDARRAAEQAVADLELRTRFVAQPDQTVRDVRSGTIWTAVDNGSDVDWFDAIEYCTTRGANWKLPTAADLLSLYQESFLRPCGERRCSVTPLIALSGAEYWTDSRDGELGAFTVNLSSGQRVGAPSISPFGKRALCVQLGAED